MFVTTPLSATVNGKNCVSNCKWLDSAPYRTITVRDCMSDLPEITKWPHNGLRAKLHHGHQVREKKTVEYFFLLRNEGS